MCHRRKLPQVHRKGWPPNSYIMTPNCLGVHGCVCLVFCRSWCYFNVYLRLFHSPSVVHSAVVYVSTAAEAAFSLTFPGHDTFFLLISRWPPALVQPQAPGPGSLPCRHSQLDQDNVFQNYHISGRVGHQHELTREDRKVASQTD